MVSYPARSVYVPDPTPDLDSARAAFLKFLGNLNRDSSLLAFHDFDADGMTAGVIWQRALERAGFKTLQRLMPTRTRSPHVEPNRSRIASHSSDGLFVLDLGVTDQPIVQDLPTCYIDHHRPEGIPPVSVLISAYSWNPIPNTSLLMWELASAIADVGDLDWIAALGIISDLGEKAPFALIAEARRKYGAVHLKEATTLINAARRSSHFDPELAVRTLLSFEGPEEMTSSTGPEIEQLRTFRREVQTEMNEGKKAAPIFSKNVALVRVRSECQIHPVIAQIWRTRLPKYIVIVAGYVPDRVHFSARCAPGTSVLDFLRNIELKEDKDTYGHGHDQASGGNLSFSRWNELLGVLGFPPQTFAQKSTTITRT